MSTVLVTLTRGHQGEDVVRLQVALGQRGFALAADGDFGAATEQALRDFQAAAGLDVDGIAGPATWRSLLGDQTATGRGLTAAGAAFIAGFEGFRGELYDDAAGHCTIGYGHLVHHGGCDGSEPGEFRQGITRQRALELLHGDAAAAAAAVDRGVQVTLTQPQFDALVSFVFNVGGGAFADSTLLARLNAGDYAAVPEQLRRWTKAGGRELEGLVRRRAAEGDLFSGGHYDAHP